MNSKTKLFTCAIVLAIFSLVNCKDEDTTPAPPADTRTKTQLIMASDWKWTKSECNVAIDKDGKNGASTDLLSQYPVCFTDNVYTFNADSTTAEKAVTKCSNEPLTYKGTWMFTNSEKNLQWNGLDYNPRKYTLRDYTVMELTATKMVLKYTEINGTDTYIITDTFTH